ncbi:MAG: hypothetical protein QM496_02000 [Verrucomicrobiota bacterium]
MLRRWKRAWWFASGQMGFLWYVPPSMADKKSIISKYFSEMGKKGGTAGKGKSKARSSEQASAAARARWAKVKREKEADEAEESE